MIDEHVHKWSGWTTWGYYGSGLDIRERFCTSCPVTEDDKRSHVHDYQRYPDPYAPIGSGLMISICSACHSPK